MYLDETQETDVEVEEKKEIVTDKAALEKLNKLKEAKELEKIKKDALEKIKDESKINLKKALKNASKDLNEENLEIAKPAPSFNNDSTDDESNNSGNESNNEESNEENDKYKLKIDKFNVPTSRSNNNYDPDEIDLDILDLKTEVSTDDEKSDLELDIEEL